MITTLIIFHRSKLVTFSPQPYGNKCKKICPGFQNYELLRRLLETRTVSNFHGRRPQAHLELNTSTVQHITSIRRNESRTH